MEFSFPCVGSIDDGIFDLGLDDDSYDDAVHPGRSDSLEGGHQSRVLSPDALDQLLAFDQGDEEGCKGGSGGDDDSSGDSDKKNVLTQSPCCDAAIAPPVLEALGAADRSKTRHPKDNGQDETPVVRKTNSTVVHSCHPVLQDTKSSCDCAASTTKTFDAGRSAEHDTSLLISPIRWPPPRETRAGGVGAGGSGDISNAFPPRLPIDSFDRGPAPTSAIDSTARLANTVYRGTKAQSSSRRLGNVLAERSPLADGASAQSRWARRRAATCEVALVAASVRKEEEALAEASIPTAGPAGSVVTASEMPTSRTLSRNHSRGRSSGGSDGRTTRHDAATGTKPAGEQRKVSFAGGPKRLVDGKDADDNAADDGEGDGDDANHNDSHINTGQRLRGYIDKEGGGDGGEGGGGGEEQGDDLLARASELHSSVAGQLRSVNELLKRKSYIYIDTSWSAKQLPCPPTAWKGKSVDIVTDNCTAVLPGGVCDGEDVTRIDAGASTSVSKNRIHPSKTPGDRPAVAFSSDANNVSVKLEGRWVSAGPNTPHIGFHSIPGEKVHDPFWKNQDAGLVVAPLDRKQDRSLFAIFDGHGTNGRRASRECMDRLPKYLVSTCRSGDPASALRRSCQQLHRHLASGTAGDYTRSGTTLCAAVLAGRRLTVANVGDSGCLRLSHSTAFPPSNAPSHGAAPAAVDVADAADATAAAPGSFCVGIGRGDHDMAAAAFSRNDGRTTATASHKAAPCDGETGARTRGRIRRGLVAQRLSRDHKPENKGERERIQAAGGIVFPLPRSGTLGDDDGGEGPDVAREPSNPAKNSEHGRHRAAGTREKGLATARDFGSEVPRVWAASGEGPGLAMSRSIGDKMAHSVGVTYEPDITEIDLNPRLDVMLVLASDGVWDVLSAEDIRKTAEVHAVKESWCPQALSADICRKSLSQWATATTGGSDDITCLVVKTGGGALPPPISMRTRRRSPPVVAADAA